MKWFKSGLEDCSLQRQLPLEVAAKTRGKVFTFGSYRLGVHTRGTYFIPLLHRYSVTIYITGADIDTLLVSPRHVRRDDFFKSFLEMLLINPAVEYARAVEEAFVPVIKTKIEGIELDILFARLALKIFHKNKNSGLRFKSLSSKVMSLYMIYCIVNM